MEVVLMVADVESYYQKVGQFANVISPLRLCPWGLKDFGVVDPSGYYLRITSLYDVTGHIPYQKSVHRSIAGRLL